MSENFTPEEQKEERIMQDYQDLMKDFEPNPLIKNTWEMRGDNYVQFSFYDENVIGYSDICLTGSLQII